MDQIIEEAKAGDMELDENYEREGIEAINSYLTYGYVDIVADGEVQ
ncbi:MAG: hypothetical protein KBA86_09605 [Bacteroidales bacterium]|nr:hypothetical protein [Bacteroidales bacterium]